MAVNSIYQDRLREKNKQLQAFRRYITFKGTGNGIREYLGEDIEVGFVREWIENRFIGAMSWDNYGEVWEIDHVVPFRVFDIFNQEDLYLCWNYRNLMPLFSHDNLKKQGNVFFSFELLHEYRYKDEIYQKLYGKIKPEVEWMSKYINNYIKINQS